MKKRTNEEKQIAKLNKLLAEFEKVFKQMNNENSELVNLECNIDSLYGDGAFN